MGEKESSGKTPAQNFITREDPFPVLVLGAFIAKLPLQITKIT